MLVLAFVLLGTGALLITSGVADPANGMLGLLGDLFEGKAPTLKAKGNPTDRAAELLDTPGSSGGGSKGTGTTAGTGGGIVAEARRQLGKPYKWGAEGPNAFDCSGFVWWVGKHGAGMTWKRLTAEGQRVTKDLVTVSAADARAGDFVFFYAPAAHAGVYLGGGQMIAAPRTGDVVKVSSVSGHGTPITYRRVK